MLTQCPECTMQVSDKAQACPHCGYPLQNAAKSRKPQQRAYRHKRLPNGFGQITKLNNPALRKPYRAMITVGKNEKGRPICRLLKPVSYFATYNEAYAALLENSKNPYVKSYTLEHVYNEWFAEASKDGRSESYINAIVAAWAYCKPLYDLDIQAIKPLQIKECVMNANTSDSFKNRIKHVLSMVYDYAVELEYVDKNCVKRFKLPKNIIAKGHTAEKEHLSFTKEEMDKLWQNSDDRYVQMVLVQCYSGWRPGELTNIRREDVDVENWTFRGGMKTKAGINRVVPIHSRIQPIVKDFYDKRGEYLFDCSYHVYYKFFRRLIERLELNPEHRPHDPRKQFITTAKESGVDEFAIKRIVGHSIEDVTENIYTVRDLEWLRSEMEKIK